MDQQRARKNLPSPRGMPDLQSDESHERTDFPRDRDSHENETKRKAQTLVDRNTDSKSKGCGRLTRLQKVIQRHTQHRSSFLAHQPDSQKQPTLADEAMTH